MLEVLINTKLSKANESFDINNLFGGIIYVESEAIDKIMYIK